jgi:hypothetical protein
MNRRTAPTATGSRKSVTGSIIRGRKRGVKSRQSIGGGGTTIRTGTNCMLPGGTFEWGRLLREVLRDLYFTL